MIQLGTDPEFVILGGDRKPRSAHHFFPFKTEKMYGPSCTQLFRDGYMLEINVPPSQCREVVYFAVMEALKFAKKQLPADHIIVSTPTVEVGQKEILEAPADVREFGCDPSRDAYRDGDEKFPALDGASHLYRYAGGHLHFSTKPSHATAGSKWLLDSANYPRAVKLLDQYVGLPLAYILHRPEHFLRRRYYGQAGEYRAQVYGQTGYRGLEYRTPSPDIYNREWLFSLAAGAARVVLNNFERLVKKWDAGVEGDLQIAINRGDGIEKLLPSLPGFYDLALLKKLRAEIGWNIMMTPSVPAPHVGIGEKAIELTGKLPLVA